MCSRAAVTAKEELDRKWNQARQEVTQMETRIDFLNKSLKQKQDEFSGKCSKHDCAANISLANETCSICVGQFGTKY
jgi:hypothetical protein